MSGRQDLLVDGAHAVMQAYDPDYQHIALGMIGPSDPTTACSTGAMGKILENPRPSIAGSTVADVQSAGNAAGGATTLVILKPTSTAVGDFLVAGITVNGGSGVTIMPPAGWTLIRRTNNGTNVGMASYYKVADATDSSTVPYSWGLGATARRASGGILRYTGVDTDAPIDQSVGGTGSDTATPFRVTAPAISAGSNTAVIGFYGIATGTAYSANSGAHRRFDARNPDAAGPSTQGATGTSTNSDYATAGLGGQFVAQHIFAGCPAQCRTLPRHDPPVQRRPSRGGDVKVDPGGPDRHNQRGRKRALQER